jgi:hypothetical protein
MPALPQSEILWRIAPDEWRGMVGYANDIDWEFNPETPENDSGEYYRGSIDFIWIACSDLLIVVTIL